jgi:hypothetical protein
MGARMSGQARIARGLTLAVQPWPLSPCVYLIAAAVIVFMAEVTVAVHLGALVAMSASTSARCRKK